MSVIRIAAIGTGRQDRRSPTDWAFGHAVGHDFATDALLVLLCDYKMHCCLGACLYKSADWRRITGAFGQEEPVV